MVTVLKFAAINRGNIALSRPASTGDGGGGDEVKLHPVKVGDGTAATVAIKHECKHVLPGRHTDAAVDYGLVFLPTVGVEGAGGWRDIDAVNRKVVLTPAPHGGQAGGQVVDTGGRDVDGVVEPLPGDGGPDGFAMPVG